ncbi:hypothetical protein BTW26_05525 [Pediococcus acidilactici]|uniref:hypothetical protein n=1 Tax=Pediococcus acidilactici TaxID=1254 RepID=UPI0009472E0D|nr:hypothetical protein [Pediococcus acidilactici]APR28502.1 hypothetical protein BTW26_05525 [Pediococcus acidilactici]
MKLFGLPISFFGSNVSSKTIQTATLFLLFGGICCILIGIVVLLGNQKKRSKVQHIVALGLLSVGILVVINNLLQYLF